jgi:molybdopterin molybdotransferase
MIEVDELRQILSENAFEPKTEKVPLDESVGRILATDYKNDRPLPPFDRVTMDGIAISAASYASGIRRFRGEKKQFAGEAKSERSNADDTCVETSTGAVLPGNCDAILPYEWLKRDGDDFEVVDDKEVVSGMNVHAEGSDLDKGEPVLTKGEVIDPQSVTVLATIGVQEVEVLTLPKTAVISTGDELVDIDRDPLPHQIRRSNDRTIEVLLQPHGIEVDRVHLPDDPIVLEHWIKDHGKRYELLIFSGGVSMGQKDHTPKVLEAAGVRPLLHKVKQRPGKPLWFGRSDELTVFGLPGNPVSAAVSTAVHIRYWLLQHLTKTTKRFAVLAEDVHFKPELTRFMPVKLVDDHGTLRAYPVPGNGSGDFISLTQTSGILELPIGKEVYEAGDAFPYFDWQWKRSSHI